MPSVIYTVREDLGGNDLGGYIVEASQDHVEEALDRTIDDGGLLTRFWLYQDEVEVSVSPRQVVAVEEYEPA